MTAAIKSGSPVAVTDQSFAEDVLASPVPVVVDLWAPWCPPCRLIAPIMAELAAEFAGRITVAKLNTDENPRVQAQLGVQGIPTLIVFKNGREVDRIVGARSRRDYQQRFTALLEE